MNVLKGVPRQHGAEGVLLVRSLPVLGLAGAAGLHVAGHLAFHAGKNTLAIRRASVTYLPMWPPWT